MVPDMLAKRTETDRNGTLCTFINFNQEYGPQGAPDGLSDINLTGITG